MAITQLIINECANWQSDHKCIGREMSSNTPFGTGKCVIILNKKECRYFERCVLPLSKYNNTERVIIDEYCMSNPSFLKKGSLRMCKCGNNSLVKGKQLCDSCRIEGRKSTWKKLKKKQRLGVLQK